MNGWIKLHRQVLEKPIWTDSTPEQKAILITLLLLANHSERQWEWQGEKYNARPGQFVTSLAKIAEKAGPNISIRNVRTAIDRFERFEFLTNESTNKNRLITIVNWANYQTSDEEGDKQNDRQPTSNRQAPDKQPTTNKKERKRETKKEKKNINQYAEFVEMTEQEYQTLVDKIGKDQTDRCVQVLDHYKGSTGKKYVSDYRAILSWVINRVEEEERLNKQRTGSGSNNRFGSSGSKPIHQKPKMVMDYRDQQAEPMTPEEIENLKTLVASLDDKREEKNRQRGASM